MAININTLGNRIKELRTSSGLSQKTIAEYLKVDQSLIAKYESGDRIISTGMLDKLSALFCIPQSSILNNEANIPSMKFSFRTSDLHEQDLTALSEINQIALHQLEMDNIKIEGNM